MADLETRYPKSPVDHTLPAITLSIRVPQAYQDFLIESRQRTWRVAFVGLAVFTFLIFWPHPPKHPFNPTYFLHVFLALVSYLAWRLQAKKPWRYEFDPQGAKFISMELFDWVWHQLKWAENPYVSVEMGAWNELPAMIITRRSKFPWMRKRLSLVYSPEDADVVTEQVVPFMAKRGTLVSEGAWYQKN